MELGLSAVSRAVSPVELLRNRMSSVPFSLLYVNEYSKEYSYSIAEAHTCLFVAHTEKRKSCSLSILSNLHKSLLCAMASQVFAPSCIGRCGSGRVTAPQQFCRLQMQQRSACIETVSRQHTRSHSRYGDAKAADDTEVGGGDYRRLRRRLRYFMPTNIPRNIPIPFHPYGAAVHA